MYRIRKNSRWWITASSWGKVGWIILIIVSLLLLFWSVFSKIDFSNLSDLNKLPELLPALLSIPFLLIWIRRYKKEIKMDRVKMFKKTGWWIIKKVTVTSIEYYEVSWDENKKWFSWYFVEAREWDMIYCSDAYSNWYRWWTSINTLEKLYQSCWFEYDKNETHKQDVLREYDKNIAEKEFEVENWWFFKKLVTNWKIFSIKDQKMLVEKWYEPPFRDVNWKRIYVWDKVDVYIDPEDEKNYWMDIDFLFEK